MSLLLLAYMIIAFVAGIVALAMPCCFSVLMFSTMGIVTVALGLLGEMIPAPGSVQIGVLQAQLAHLLTAYFGNSSGLELVGVLGVALILTSVFALRNHIRKPLEPARIEGD